MVLVNKEIQICVPNKFIFFLFHIFMKKIASKGFTLIELLVVITIIGILATGATAVYTSAQQKARDSIRQNDVLALRSAVEQSFGDNALYPSVDSIGADVIGDGYMQAFPSDPKSGQADADTLFEYIYGAAQDEITLVTGQEYEISSNFENTGNAESKEANAADGGGDADRWEVGINMDVVDTSADTTAVTGDNVYEEGVAAVDAVTINADTPAS